MAEIDAMDELHTMLAKLLETARKLPPGPDRHEALKEIGLMRRRLDAMVERSVVAASSTPKSSKWLGIVPKSARGRRPQRGPNGSMLPNAQPPSLECDQKKSMAK